MEKDVVVKKRKEKFGIISGFIMIVIAIILLFVNEASAVDAEKVISLAKDSYIEVSSSKIDKNNDGKLVVTNGKINLINDMIYDQDFNVGVKTAKLVRTVEMYQWSEKCEDSENGKETCTYTKNWSNTIIDDTNFESGHVNPDTMPYSSSELYMSNVNLGEYILDVNLLQQLSTNKKYTDLDEKVAKSKNLNIIDGMFTTYEEENKPEIGDVRISFLYNDASDISVIGVQSENKFVKFSPEGTNYEILELRESILNGKEFINEFSSSNSLKSWIFRLIGTLLMIFGILSILSFISYLASFIPFLGKIVINGVFIVSLLIGTSLSLFVIAISWFVVRPVLSIILILIIIGLIVLLYKYNKKKKTNNTNEAVNNEVKE